MKKIASLVILVIGIVSSITAKSVCITYDDTKHVRHCVPRDNPEDGDRCVDGRDKDRTCNHNNTGFQSLNFR